MKEDVVSLFIGIFVGAVLATSFWWQPTVTSCDRTLSGGYELSNFSADPRGQESNCRYVKSRVR